MTHSAYILLATYNGARYLREQLDSIFHQTVPDLQTIAGDDGSTDGTEEILQTSARERPGSFTVLPPESQRLGPAKNFSRLLEYALGEAERHSVRYLLFCDQDDVWLPHKAETLLARMRAVEARVGKRPVLVHGDLSVVDPELRLVSSSLWRYQGIEPGHTGLNRLLMQNTVTGCATVINAELARLALPIPEQCIMHDWWLALTASAFGCIESVDDPLVLYRQHGSNDTGARKWDALHALRNAGRHWTRADFRRKLSRHVAQAKAFYERFDDRLPERQRRVLEDFIGLPHLGTVKRKWTVVRRRFFAAGMLRNAAIVLRI